MCLHSVWKVYFYFTDEDKQVTVERTSGSDDLGLHLLNSHPAFITSVDQGESVKYVGGVVPAQSLILCAALLKFELATLLSISVPYNITT